MKIVKKKNLFGRLHFFLGPIKGKIWPIGGLLFRPSSPLAYSLNYIKTCFSAAVIRAYTMHIRNEESMHTGSICLFDSLHPSKQYLK